MENPPSLTAEPQPRYQRLPLTLAALVLTILAFLLVVAHGLYDTARKNVEEHLALIVRIKAEELTRWIEAKPRSLIQPVDGRIAVSFSRWQKGELAPSRLPELLADLVNTGRLESADILAASFWDRDGRLVYASDSALLASADTYRPKFAAARISGKPLLMDLRLPMAKGTGKDKALMDVVVPLVIARGEQEETAGYLVYQLDPSGQLFPLVNNWPVPSSSAESTLLRREGDMLVILSPTKNLATEPMSLRFPLDQPERLSAVAMQAGAGKMVAAPDYRDVPGFGVVAEIPAMGWHLLAKVDQAEVYAKVRGEALVLGGAAFLLLCAAAMLRWLLEQPERRRQLAVLSDLSLARRRAEDMFRKVVEFASEGILVSNADDRVLFANQRMHDLVGYVSPELIGVDPVIFVEEKSAPLFLEYRAQRRQMGAVAQRAEWKFRHRDGSWHDILVSATPLRTADGAYDGSIVLVTDISELKQASQALRESEARFRTIFDSVEDAIFLQSPEDGAILAVNRRACEMYGYTEDEFQRCSVNDLSSGEGGYNQATANTKLAAPSSERHAFPWHARRKDGSLFWVEVAIREAVIAGKNCYLVAVRDISLRRAQEELVQHTLDQQMSLNKKLEEAQGQLLQSEKMASIGQLAAGVAHELNNPISFVYSNLGTLADYLRDLFEVFSAYEAVEKEHQDKDCWGAVKRLKTERDFNYLRQDTFQLMEESRDGLNRVRKIVQDLKDFSRVGESNWQWADLHKGLDSTLNIVWNELKYKCKVVKQYGQLPDVYCLPSQLNQVFMNLLVNAGQAIEDKGEITIATGVLATEGGQQEVWVSIRDTGKGIPSENMNRIFEPFFTTKPVGKGTGLGLSLSYSIVGKHQGHIDVESEVGVGTTFTVRLPVKPDVNEDPAKGTTP